VEERPTKAGSLRPGKGNVWDPTSQKASKTKVPRRRPSNRRKKLDRDRRAQCNAQSRSFNARPPLPAGEQDLFAERKGNEGLLFGAGGAPSGPSGDKRGLLADLPGRGCHCVEPKKGGTVDWKPSKGLRLHRPKKKKGCAGSDGKVRAIKRTSSPPASKKESPRRRRRPVGSRQRVPVRRGKCFANIRNLQFIFHWKERSPVLGGSRPTKRKPQPKDESRGRKGRAQDKKQTSFVQGSGIERWNASSRGARRSHPRGRLPRTSVAKGKKETSPGFPNARGSSPNQERTGHQLKKEPAVTGAADKPSRKH